jgi:hypothetical protein
MSARKIKGSNIFASENAAVETRLSLSAKSVRLRKSGIEFLTNKPILAWTELSLDLQFPDSKKVHCSGVVVACDGNRHSGYVISLLFTKLSRQSQALVSALAYA